MSDGIASSQAQIDEHAVSDHELLGLPKIIKSLRLHYKRLAPLLASHLFIDIYNSLLPIVSPLLIQKYALSLLMAGSLNALLSFTGAFLQPLYGFLCDRFHTKRFILLAPILIFLSTLGIAFAPNLLVVCFSLVLLGTGFSLYHPKSTATVGILSPEHRSTFVSLFVAFGALGSALSPFFILLFVSSNPATLKNLLYAGLPAIVAFACLWSVYKKGHKSDQKTVETKKQSTFGLKQLMAVCRKKDLILLSLVVTLRSATILTLIAFLSQLITDNWQQSLALAAFAATLLSVGSLLGGLTGGVLADRFNARSLLAFSLMLAAPCLIGFILFKSLTLLFLGSFLSAWSNSISVSLSQQTVPLKAQSFASSFTMGLAWGLGAMIIPLVGWFADNSNLSHSMLCFIPGPIFLAGITCLFLTNSIDERS